jgi:hypothetical protein
MALVHAVHLSAGHSFSKQAADAIRVVAGIGIEGDAHAGSTVKHRSRVKIDPMLPNLRQVHLIHAELFVELAAQGFDVAPGDLGENITTSGVDLLGLPTGALVRIGSTALLAVTGLRNPCTQIEAFRSGLLAAVAHKQPDGRIVRKSGVMAVVLQDGTIRPGDAIAVALPPEPHLPLERV